MQNFLLSDFKNQSDDDSDGDITFKQWVTTDQSNIITRTLNAEDLICLLWQLHSYIVSHQSQYLKDLKGNLTNGQVIVFWDFVTKNNQFLTQDEEQGCHRCTPHPVVVHYTYEEKLISSSICIISYDLKNDIFCLPSDVRNSFIT